MKNGNKTDRVWTISLMILGVLSLIVGVASIVGYEDIPHPVRMAIAVVQILAGTIFIVATVFKFKNRKANDP